MTLYTTVDFNDEHEAITHDKPTVVIMAEVANALTEVAYKGNWPSTADRVELFHLAERIEGLAERLG